MSGEMKKGDLGNLSAQLKTINRTNLDDMESALRLLRGDAAPDPAAYPTRQQRRAAERAAQKAKR